MKCVKCDGSVDPNAISTVSKVRKGEVVYSHRICPRRLKAPKRKTYQLKKPEKRGWVKARDVALMPRCEVSGHVFATIRSRKQILYVGRIVDHIVPERLAAATKKDPHVRLNLICISDYVHGRKRAAEDQLLKSGDVLTYLSTLAMQDWPMERVHAALRFYGIRHGAGCPVCARMASEVQDQQDPRTQSNTGETDGREQSAKQ
jgi:hypothetical protein